LSGQTQYALNSVNEITNSILGFWSAFSGWSGTVPVTGSTTSPATNVTVNGTGANLYGDNAFELNKSVNAGSNGFTAIAYDVYGRVSTNTSSVTIVPTNNAYVYDLNGNLLTDGARYFAYDDENELISVWKTNTWRNDFVYDGKMRRRIERDYGWGGSSWIQTNEIRFIYDGNLVVQERDANNTPQVTYTRGNDLSGKLQGAGGIGGLLARTENTSTIDSPLSTFATAFYHADGNGNITCLIYPSQMIAAKYLFDPYGNALAQYGSLSDANIYRFSSVEWNVNSGTYYYLYRFYDPYLQRWSTRDPARERGFSVLSRVARKVHSYTWNQYVFTDNDPVIFIDPLGLQPIIPEWLLEELLHELSGESTAGSNFGPCALVSKAPVWNGPFDPAGSALNQSLCTYRCWGYGDSDVNGSKTEQTYTSWTFTSCSCSPPLGPNGQKPNTIPYNPKSWPQENDPRFQ
jgi:RHS repeat-associated protein